MYHCYGNSLGSLSKVGPDSTACSAKFDAGCGKLDGFGCLEGRFGHQIGCQKRRRGRNGPSYAKSLENVAQWSPRGEFGHLLEVSNHPGDALGFTLASLGATFRDLFAKHVFLRFRCLSSAELLLLKV